MKIEKIEALRGFVAIYVACSHILYYRLPLEILGINIWGFGNVGVIVFFILSGFVIQYSYTKAKDKSFKSYFFKRFFRIYIPLFFVCAFGSLIILLQQNYSFISIRSLLGTLLMIQDIPYVKPNNICIPFLQNMPLWSLALEWWFYMIFFFIIKYLKDRAAICVYALSIVGAVSYAYFPFFVSKVFLYMPIWWFGVELAKLYMSGSKISFHNLKLPIIILCLLYLIMLVADYVQSDKWWSYASERSSLLSSLVIIAVLLLWFKTGWKYFNKTIGIFTPFAKISYMIYIAHWPLIHTATYLNFISNEFVRYSLYTIICLGFCYLVEVVCYPRMNKYFMSRLFPARDMTPIV